MKKLLTVVAVVFLLGLFLAVWGGTPKGGAAISGAWDKIAGGFSDSLNKVNYDLDEASMFVGGQTVYRDDVPKYCPGSGIKNLDAEMGGCILKIVSSGDGSFYIEAERVYKFQGFVKDDTLYIRSSNGTKTWDKLGSCEITVYVPGDFQFDAADIRIGAGVLEAAELRVKDRASMEVGGGQITIDSLRSGDLELEVGAGEIDLKQMTVEGQCSVKVGVGNFKGTGSLLADTCIECAMGNVSLNLEGGQKNYNYRLECAMGSISLAGVKYSGLVDEQEISNGADRMLDIACAMGNVTVSFP